MMEKGRVKSESGLNLRLKPNGGKIGVLSHDEEFTILDEVTFYRVKSKTGQVGYVHSAYVEKNPSENVLADASVAKKNDYSPDFKPVIFTNESYMGEAVRVDQDFVKDLDRLGQYASQCKVKIWVTSSLRQLNNQIKGAIVKPATHSCHHIGHAIDMNLLHEDKIYNSKMLKKANHKNLPESIQNFFESLKSDTILRWGGDFSQQDPVHIDDNFFNNQNLMYQAKLDSRIAQLNA